MNNERRIVATVEARMTSSRLPGKVMMKCCGKPVLQHIIERIRRSKVLDDIVIATTVNEDDDAIVKLCEDIGCHYYRGSEDDVLDRVVKAAKEVRADVVVELTGDCPFIDWRHINALAELFMSGDYDFASNNMERTFPLGFDIRIMKAKLLEGLNEASNDPLDHEHVSIHFPEHQEKYNCLNWRAEGIENRPELEVTLDEMEDYILINKIYEGLYYQNNDFSCFDVIKFIDKNNGITDLISKVKRTEINYHG